MAQRILETLIADVTAVMAAPDDTDARSLQHYAMDQAFAAAMAAAPEGRPFGVNQKPGTEGARTIRPAVTPIIRSSSGW
jgi:hypothetical protein